MPANSKVQPALEDAVQSVASVANAKLDSTIDDLRERASRVAHDTLDTIDTLRSRYRPYVDDAGERLQVAERYIVERVQKQPLTTTLAVLGIGVLVGLVLSSGRSR